MAKITDTYTIKKSIRITKEQAENWDPDFIRKCLTNGNEACPTEPTEKYKHLLRFMYNLMNEKMVWKEGQMKTITEEDKQNIKEVRDL